MQEFRFWAYIFVLVVSVFVGVVRFKRLTAPIKYLLLLLVITMTSELFAHFYAKIYRHNLFVYHFFTPIHFLVSGLIFYNILEAKKNQVFIVGGIIGFILFSIINSIFFQGLNRFPSNILILESILLVLSAILINYERLQEANKVQINNPNIFWLTAAIIFFYSSSFIFFGFHNFLRKTNRPLLQDLYVLLWVINMIMYLIFLFLMIKDKKK